ncbi:MAG TPA: hypothetical protein VGB87_06240 [Vicinamibacteria bacterium]
MRRRTVFAPLAVAGTALAATPTAHAQQAWLPPKGEASLSLGFAHILATEHRNDRGDSVTPGDMIWNNVVSDLSYGVTDRLAVRLNVPFVTSRYGGAFPHRPVPERENLDDGNWHHTFQDLLTEVRFRATRGPLVLTPFAAMIVPTHYYEYYGHGAAGRKLVEGQVGVVAGRLLDPFLPNAYVQVRYVLGIPEKVLGVSHNRSQLSFDVGYLLGSAFSVRAFGTWQKTHGGWRAPIDFPAPTSSEFRVHDQVGRADYLRLGGAVSYSITGSLDVNVSGYGTLAAKNDVNMSGLGLSLTWSASPAQLIRKRRGQEDETP